MLSFQNLQPYKHDVEDGINTDVRKKGRGKYYYLFLKSVCISLRVQHPQSYLSQVFNI